MFDTDEICMYLEKIKNRCDNMSSCGYCMFNGNYSNCRIVEVVRRLNEELEVEPCCWNIKQIEKILEEE